MRTTAARILGAATLGYGAAVAWRPGVLLRPCGLPRDEATTPLTRALGVRDALIGAAMLLVPPPALPAAVLTRAASDLGDALTFGFLLPERPARAKAAASALTWAALCAWTLTGGAEPAPRVREQAGHVAVRAAQSLSRSTV